MQQKLITEFLFRKPEPEPEPEPKHKNSFIPIQDKTKNLIGLMETESTRRTDIVFGNDDDVVKIEFTSDFGIDLNGLYVDEMRWKGESSYVRRFIAHKLFDRGVIKIHRQPAWALIAQKNYPDLFPDTIQH